MTNMLYQMILTIFIVGLDFALVDEFINFDKGDGMNMVAYNPSLYELADDDSQYFDYQNNGAFLEEPRSIPSSLLDDELQQMLTTDRDKLRTISDSKGDNVFSTS